MASPNSGANDFERTPIFHIVWFLGLSILLYMVGNMYELPKDFVPWYQWAFGISLVGLAGCLLWFASNAVRRFLKPKVFRLLDKAGRGIDRLKKILGGGNTPQQ